MRKIGFLVLSLQLFTFLSAQNPASALNFDGIDDHVTALDPNFGTGNFTIETWFKTSSSNGVLLTNRTSESAGPGKWWTLSLVSGSLSLEFGQSTASSYSSYTAPGTFFVSGAWNHVAAVRNGTLVLLYINGALVLTSSDPTVRDLTSGNNTLTFAGWPYYNVGWYNGSMDETRIWNVARTQCQVNTYMNCEIPSAASGLIGNYHYNQGISLMNNSTVTTLVDASASANTGMLSSMALGGGVSNWVDPGAFTSGFSAPSFLTISVTIGHSVICNGQATTLTATGANTYSWTNGITNNVSFSPTVTATYTVSGTSSVTTCSGTAVANVTVNALPLVVASSNMSLICAGQVASLAAGGANSYLWSTGSTGTVIVVSPTVNASYTVTGTDTNSCSNTAIITQSVSDCTGIRSMLLNKPDIRVYPNPNNGEFIISTGLDIDMSIVNVLGQAVRFNSLTTGNDRKISLCDPSAGIYFILSGNPGQAVRKKIIVSK